VTPAGDGANLVAWVGYLPGAGDFLFTATERDGKLEDVTRVTQRPGDIFRPVWARYPGTTLLLWTQTPPGQGPRIFHSFKQDRGWSEPAEIPGQAPYTLNPEATALSDGRIA